MTFDKEHRKTMFQTTPVCVLPVFGVFFFLLFPLCASCLFFLFFRVVFVCF